METLAEAAESLAPTSSDFSNLPNWIIPNDDQRFLLLFIMGTYFGPDLKGEKPKKSVLQRMAEGLPPYTSDQLAGSQMKLLEAEKIYYYVLREAGQSVIVKPPILHLFFQGNLFNPAQDAIADYRQFPDLFPPHLHPQSQLSDQCHVIENIVFINNPEISYIKPEDVERFKRLTRLEDLLLDRNAAMSHTGDGVSGVTNSNSEPQKSNGKLPLRRSSRNSHKRQYSDYVDPEEAMPPIHDAIPFNSVPFSSTPMPCKSVPMSVPMMPTELKAEPAERMGSAMLILPSHPTSEEWNNIVATTKNGIALTGSVAERQAGPLIGLVDIGVCEDAYLFRISLPGVRKDEKEFSCEVETDGRVLIKGATTTGEKLVYKNSQVFEMQTQYLCPSGHFSVAFQLPGPVEPREFSGNFGADGILEGIVMKERSRR
ncbi:PREDICTED: increased DNA methylation 2-like [Nelumbo nucifera]|uniref:Increased DNA methylation 2-like n=1 Tax=Nelumbo nucifera TaxID=4432 RepID=A0A1U8BE36_NELNU|nr:PREDICTED: increased DNA methylation 2-like [Nelumbo nucifera]XP_010278225.1 PREDICTED: increased DNA methylation 2-like [Nelumbo nucifera]XP_010278230.1 PREDICTED: increased DNA methylation 2-like [Nelumbo nucifera]XP_019055825.1 PREDICTED: increased DNA methylation 2-like [Nelumbo nucifera]